MPGRRLRVVILVGGGLPDDVADLQRYRCAIAAGSELALVWFDTGNSSRSPFCEDECLRAVALST